MNLRGRAIAHDLENLMSIVKGAASMLPQATGPQRRRLVDLLERTCMEALALIQDLRKPPRNRVADDPPFDVSDYLTSHKDMFQHAVSSTVTLSVRCEPCCLARVQKSYLLNAVLNLLLNAREALGATGGRIALSVQTISVGEDDPAHPSLARDSYVQILVADDGPGMDPEILEQVRKAGFSTRSARKSPGLGLWNVANFARRAGGGFDIKSSPGAGCLASLFVPAERNRAG